MVAAKPHADALPDVLSKLTGRPVPIGEIVAALGVGRSTYYEQRDDGRLINADNLLRVAAAMNLNPIELMLHCGLVSSESVADCSARLGADGSATPDAKSQPRRFRPRADLPPL